MTAKELKEAARFGEGPRSRRKGYKFYDDEMQAFIDRLCKEQREIIMKAINDSHYSGHRTEPLTINEIAEILLNAKQP